MFIPISILFALMGILFLFLHLLKAYQRRKKRRSPFTSKFLREPGRSLIERLDEINDDLQTYLLALILIPTISYAVIISDLYFRNAQLTFAKLLIYFCIGIAFIGFILVKMIRLINLRRKARLGYDGEVATGQELNRMMLSGYHVFHDFVADKFNIDHIVVGPAGVFAVETKARSKPVSGNNTEDAKVQYDGKRLHFPGWEEVKPLEQAKIQASWLEKWLTLATGEKTLVRPVLALPGWYVTRTAPEGIPVINPRQFPGIAKPKSGYVLDERRIKRIVHQIDQRCRNLESTAVNGLGGTNYQAS